VSDDADRAQVINEQYQADVIAKAQRNRFTGISNRFCAECEEPIPEARRTAVPGCKLCVSCQQQQEHLLGHWRAL
jgi:phage/conjugal plasmid C-4 type zinc finger TraR family protein